MALAEEKRDIRRAMLIWLLSAARLAEVVRAHRDELVGDDWVIPASRSKNSHPHVIRLGPWGRSLMATNGEWVFPAPRVAGPRKYGWYKARDRVLARMSQLAGHSIERFTPHDFRRTARSYTKRLKVDFETAEAMMNHLKSGLERIYDGYELEEKKAAWFLKWEEEIIGLARKAGVAPSAAQQAAVDPTDSRLNVSSARPRRAALTAMSLSRRPCVLPFALLSLSGEGGSALQRTAIRQVVLIPGPLARRWALRVGERAGEDRIGAYHYVG